jgi:hypothetical protein
MKPLAILNAMIYIRKVRASGTMPVRYVLKPSFKQNGSNETEKSIVAFIEEMGGIAERTKVMGRKVGHDVVQADVMGKVTQVSKARWIRSTGKKGSADVHATYKGKSYSIEVKYGKDRMSDYQRNYASKFEKAGGIYMIAKDFDSWCMEFCDLSGIDLSRLEEFAKRGMIAIKRMAEEERLQAH